MAYADLYNPANVKIGNALGWYAPYITPGTATLPANSVALWGAWGGNWVEAGATEESYQTNVTDTVESHRIEEQTTPVFISTTSRDFVISAQLAEDTLQTLALAWGGTITTSTNSDDFKFSSEVGVWSFGLEMSNLLGLARRIYIPKAVVNSAGATAFRRSASKRLYPLTITPICQPEEIIVRDTKVVA